MFDDYLRSTPSIDHSAAGIRALIEERGLHALDEVEAARRAFEFVRDEISHSWDVRSHRVTRTATEALQHGEGLCYSKAMLLAALLRALGIPAGLGYQRLTVGDTVESGFCVHGLTTAFVSGRWIRLDARGNKEGVNAQFSLDEERLAFNVRPEIGELDYSVNLSDPHPSVLAALASHDDLFRLVESLPNSL